MRELLRQLRQQTWTNPGPQVGWFPGRPLSRYSWKGKNWPEFGSKWFNPDALSFKKGSKIIPPFERGNAVQNRPTLLQGRSFIETLPCKSQASVSIIEIGAHSALKDLYGFQIEATLFYQNLAILDCFIFLCLFSSGIKIWVIFDVWATFPLIGGS